MTDKKLNIVDLKKQIEDLKLKLEEESKVIILDKIDALEASFDEIELSDLPPEITERAKNLLRKIGGAASNKDAQPAKNRITSAEKEKVIRSFVKDQTKGAPFCRNDVHEYLTDKLKMSKVTYGQWQEIDQQLQEEGLYEVVQSKDDKRSKVYVKK